MTQDTCLGWALLSGHELVFLCAHPLYLAHPHTPPAHLLLPTWLGPLPPLPCLPPPRASLLPACCRGLIWAPAPSHLHLSPPPSSQNLAWLAPLTPRAAAPPPHTQSVPLICLRVELKGQISKNPSYGSGKRAPGAQTSPGRGWVGGGKGKYQRPPYCWGHTLSQDSVRSDDQLPPGDKERTVKVGRGQRARNTKPAFSAFSTKFKGALGQY